MSNNFSELFNVDISKFTEKKGKYTYLSWAWAWKLMKEKDNEAKCVVKKYGEYNYPYLQTPIGYFVEVSITYKGITETESLPVLDNYNKVIENPDAFDINNSIKRCKVKAIALHGLGLGLWINEDICDSEQKSTQKKTEYKKVESQNNTQQPQKPNREEMSKEDINNLKEQIHKLCENMSPDEKRAALKKASHYVAKTSGKESFIDDINELKRGNYDTPSWQLKLTLKKLQEAMLSKVAAEFVSDTL